MSDIHVASQAGLIINILERTEPCSSQTQTNSHQHSWRESGLGSSDMHISLGSRLKTTEGRGCDCHLGGAPVVPSFSPTFLGFRPARLPTLLRVFAPCP